MCGIFLSNILDKNLNLSLFKNLNHRGPDAGNLFKIDNNIFIGHTLLSIRDKIDNSIQPVYSENKRYVFSFNGQIYNLEELKKKFQIPKHVILDTTILKEIINIKGIDFHNEISGMFSIILFDRLQKKIFLFRDNTGQKPLYYYIKDKKIIVASEIYSILYNINDIDICEKSIFNSLKFVTNTDEQTIYQNIFKVLPGQIVEINLNGELNKKFFSHKFKSSNEPVDRIISKTVKNHLQSYRKICLNLSGGIDSNILLYEIKNQNADVDMISTKFITSQEKYNKDFHLAKEIAEKNGYKFIENVISEEDYVNNFSKSYEKLEEINGNINIPAYDLNYKQVSGMGYKTLLNGDGGDEIFIGYKWYLNNQSKINNKIKKISRIFDKSYYLKTLIFFQFFLGYDVFQNTDFYRKNFNSYLNNVLFYKNNTENFKRFKKKFFSEITDSFEFINLIATQFFWLSNDTFNRTDKLLMSYSVEGRSPLSDYNLRRNILNKINLKEFNTNITKQKIKEVYREKIDNKIFNEKLGWAVPSEWLLNKKLREEIIDKIPVNNYDIGINWSLIKKTFVNNDNFMMQKHHRNIISLILVLDKFKQIKLNQQNL